MTREPRIVIIGAGLAGIATAVTLQRKGFQDFTILEKGADVGGVWHWNRYPGLTCDVPSQLYQFSFAPKPDWTGMFAPGEEIQRYLREVVARFGLDKRLRLNAEVVSTEFTGQRVADLHRRRHRTGSRLRHRGNRCAAPSVHAGYPRDSTRSTGESCTPPGGTTKSRPAAAESPSSETVRPECRSCPRCSARPPTSRTSSRTPQWVIWAPMERRSPRSSATSCGGCRRMNRRLYDGLLWGSRILADIATRPSWQRRLIQNYARWCLRLQVRDRGYATGSRRTTSHCVSGKSYQALTTEQSRRTTPSWSPSAIEEITPTRHPHRRRPRNRDRPPDIRHGLPCTQLHAADEPARP